MKRIYTMLLAGLALCAVSCQEKNLETGKTMTFTASLAETKTAIQGNKSVWVTGDMITINGVELTAVLPDGMKEAETATFTGVVTPNSGSPKYVATYGKFNANQKAVAGNYDPAVVELTAESDNHDLFFRNTTTLLKFNVIEEGVNKVAFVPAEGETITLSGENMKGIYYMAIKPGTYRYFDIKQNDSPVRAYVNPDKAFVPEVSKIINLGDLKHTGVYLKGDFNKWSESHEFVETGRHHFVIRNLTLTKNNSFKVYVSSWNDKWLGTNYGPINPNQWFGLATDQNGNATISEDGTYTVCYNVNDRNIRFEK